MSADEVLLRRITMDELTVEQAASLGRRVRAEPENELLRDFLKATSTDAAQFDDEALGRRLGKWANRGRH